MHFNWYQIFALDTAGKVQKMLSSQSTIRRLSRESEMLKTYGSIIAEKGKCSSIEKVKDTNSVQYIMHHPVKKKLRYTIFLRPSVRDCSSIRLRFFQSCFWRTRAYDVDIVVIVVL